MTKKIYILLIILQLYINSTSQNNHLKSQEQGKANTEGLVASNEFIANKVKISSNLSFTSSNLPILVIKNHEEIPDEPKINATLGIIYNGPGKRNNLSDKYNHYNGQIGIERRGNSTQNYPKKPYNIETRDSAGENLNVPLFWMPEENDWVLRASYFDHTFIRNPLACHMSRLAGRWASRCQMVELVLNGEYQGIYVFMEKLKRDKGRLDIAELNPDEITEPDISGGYIYEISGFGSNFGESRTLKYPVYEETPQEQINYIRQYDDNFRKVMNSPGYTDKITGYPAWIDVESFVDELIVQEAMRNSDAYGWSGYFHKDKDGKLKAGPVWDFDQSAGNSSYPDDGVIEGWMFNHPQTNNTPFFWPLLFEDPFFSYKVRKRWEQLRKDVFKTENLMGYIDSIADLLDEAQQREFEKWPVLGVYVWRETSGFETRYTYNLEVEYLKEFLSRRWQWMDRELAKIENPDPNSINSFSVLNDVFIYPNPVKDYVVFNLDSKESADAAIFIYNSTGTLINRYESLYLNQGNNNLSLNMDNLLQPGFYIYKIIINNEVTCNGRFIKIN